MGHILICGGKLSYPLWSSQYLFFCSCTLPFSLSLLNGVTIPLPTCRITEENKRLSQSFNSTIPPLPPAANLPPTLAKSQVSSVRKNLKLHLVAVLRHQSSLEFLGQISTLLLDLGMNQNDINRITPAHQPPRKRSHGEHHLHEGKKKSKIGQCTLLVF